MQENILLYAPLSLAFLLKILKYFEVTLNIFQFSHVKKIVEFLLVSARTLNPNKAELFEGSFFWGWEEGGSI